MAIPQGSRKSWCRSVKRAGIFESSHISPTYVQTIQTLLNLTGNTNATVVTTQTGGFLQTSTGRMVVDMSYGPYPSDQLNVTGHAILGGTVDVTLLKLTDDQPLHLITTTLGATVNGATAPGTLALSYGLAVDGKGVFTGVFFAQERRRPAHQRHRPRRWIRPTGKPFRIPTGEQCLPES